MEIIINNVERVYDVVPDNISGLYTHYEADQGNVYLHIYMDEKNGENKIWPVIKF